MSDLTLHDVPADELRALEARGARHGRSLQDEAKHLIHEAAAEERLLQDLERATRAVDDRLRDAGAGTESARAAAPPRGRYRRFEPTPRRR
jgi:plasmid stability protein